MGVGDEPVVSESVLTPKWRVALQQLRELQGDKPPTYSATWGILEDFATMELSKAFIAVAKAQLDIPDDQIDTLAALLDL